MVNLHEQLGKEIEKRLEAEEQFQKAFRMLQGLCQVILEAKIGKINLDDINIEVSDVSAGWSLLNQDQPQIGE